MHGLHAWLKDFAGPIATICAAAAATYFARAQKDIAASKWAFDILEKRKQLLNQAIEVTLNIRSAIYQNTRLSMEHITAENLIKQEASHLFSSKIIIKAIEIYGEFDILFNNPNQQKKVIPGEFWDIALKSKAEKLMNQFQELCRSMSLETEIPLVAKSKLVSRVDKIREWFLGF